MVAAVVSMTILGRRAELHIIRGAGQSPLAVLRAYMLGALVLGGFLVLIIAPLTLNFEGWSRQIKNPSVNPALERFAGPYTAWISLDQGTAQARLENYQADTGEAAMGQLVYTQDAGANGPNLPSNISSDAFQGLGFFFLENIVVRERQLAADLRSPLDTPGNLPDA